MKFKNYINVLVLIFVLIGCKQKEKNHAVANKDCIEKIIKTDDSLGTIRNYECEKISLSQTISNYANSLNNLDFTGCPEQFKTAFKNHEQAWRNMMVLTNNYPELRGEMHDLFDTIKTGKDSAAFNPLLKNIWDTWAIIEKEIK
ncbi:hypothetical protein [Hwangdonia sp.]|uniref:hypothetical protein n=1 Tax=Hwangdonia sp. TaxID=1883432 RepID=UPI003AB8B1DF